MQQSGRCWDLLGWGAGWGTPWCTQASQKNPRSPPNFVVLLGPSSSLSQYNQFAQHQQQLLCCSFLYNFKIISPCGTRVNRNPSLCWCKWRPIQLLRQSISSPGLLTWPLWILLPRSHTTAIKLPQEDSLQGDWVNSMTAQNETWHAIISKHVEKRLTCSPEKKKVSFCPQCSWQKNRLQLTQTLVKAEMSSWWLQPPYGSACWRAAGNEDDSPTLLLW